MMLSKSLKTVLNNEFTIYKIFIENDLIVFIFEDKESEESHTVTYFVKDVLESLKAKKTILDYSRDLQKISQEVDIYEGGLYQYSTEVNTQTVNYFNQNKTDLSNFLKEFTSNKLKSAVVFRQVA